MADLDAKLGITITTQGVEAIRKLAADVQQLASEGGDAAPEFRKLAAEIAKIADQAAGVTAIDELRSEIVQLATVQESAVATAKEHRTALEKLEAAHKEAGTAQRAAGDAQRAAAADAGRAKDALEAYRKTSDSSTQQTTVYRTELKRLSAEHLAAKEAVRVAKEAYAQAGQATKDAGKAVTQYRQEVREADRALKAANSAIDDRTKSLSGLTEALAKSGVETVDLGTAQDQLRTSLQTATTAVTSQQAAVVKLTEAQAKQAAFLKYIAESNDRNIAIATRAARERGIIDARNAAFARDAATAQARAAAVTAEANAKAVASAKAAAAALQEQSVAAGRAFEDAFGKTGVRSANAIEKEIRDVDQALVRLAADARVTGTEFSRAFTAGQTRIAALRKELSGVPEAINRTGGAVGFLKGQLGQLTAIYSGIELGKQFFEANVELQTLRRSLTAVTGSSEAAAQQIAFLQGVANDSGLAIGALSQDFLRFNAAASGAGKSSQFINETFETVANGAGRMGISTQRVGLIFNALTQTISKGKPTLEELQGQLAESLPGGLSVLANGLGVTTQRLLEMVKAGELTNDEFFAGLTRGLEGLVGQTQRVEGLVASWNRFKNALTAASQQAADSTALRALSSVLDKLAENMNRVVDGAFVLTKAFIGIKIANVIADFLGFRRAADAAALAQERGALAARGHTAATEADTVAVNRNTAAKQANAVAFSQLGTLLGQTAPAASKNAQAMTELGKGLAATAVASGGAANGMNMVQGWLAKVRPAVEASTSKVNLLGAAFGAVTAAGRTMLSFVGGMPGLLIGVALSAKEAGNWLAEMAAKATGLFKAEQELEKQFAAEAAAAKAAAAAQREKQAASDQAFRTLTEQISKQVDAAEVQVKVSVKLAEARKLEGDAQRDIIALSGDEQASRVQAAQSASAYAEAAARTVAARAAEIELLRTQVAQMEEAALRTGGLTVARQEELTKIKETIAVKEAEAEKSRQVAAAAQIEAAGLKITALAYQDNADKLAQYSKELDDSRASLEAVRELQQQGLATQALVQTATIALSVAEAKYRDAVNDTTEAVQRRIALRNADQGISDARIKLQIQEYKNEEQYALAVGNTTLALYNKIRQKELEAASVRKSAAAKAEEARIEGQRAVQELAELQRLGTLTPAKQLELQLRIANANQKAIEAETSKRVADGIDRETDALRINNDVKRESIALSNERTAADSAAADAGRNTRNSQAGSALGGDPFFELLSKKQNGRLEGGDLKLAEAVYDNMRHNLDVAQRSPAGAFSLAAQQDARAQFVQSRIILDKIRSLGTGGASAAGGTSEAAPDFAAGASTPSPVSGGTTVNITLNGRTTSVKVASQSDANALTTLLQQLEDDAARGG